jgi:hypothetical protein
MTRAVSGRCLVRNNNLNRGAVALPYRSRKVPLLSTTRDTSFPSFIAFATIPSAVDLRSRTWVYPAFSSFQINSCSAALTCEEPVVPWFVGGRVDGVVLGCASAGNAIARKQATVQAANRQLMMHSPEYARAWMAPHKQPTLGRVVPAHMVVPLRLPPGLPCPLREQRSSSRYQVMAAATLSPHPKAHAS